MKAVRSLFKRAWRRVQVRIALRHADRALARARRAPNPGYDELIEPAFAIVMTAAVLALIFDPGPDSRALLDWLQSVVATLRAWA